MNVIIKHDNKSKKKVMNKSKKKLKPHKKIYFANPFSA